MRRRDFINGGLAARLAQLHKTWSWATTAPTKMALIGFLRALNGL
jgi:hypothetical protein